MFRSDPPLMAVGGLGSVVTQASEEVWLFKHFISDQ